MGRTSQCINLGSCSLLPKNLAFLTENVSNFLSLSSFQLGAVVKNVHSKILWLYIKNLKSLRDQLCIIFKCSLDFGSP
jgi:hypothetical protein